MFKEELKRIVDNVQGGRAAVLMGFDGIAVEWYVREDDELDIQTVGMELSVVMSQIRKAASLLEAGPVQEVALKADKLVLVFRILTEDYFVLVALEPEGNFGKARFLLRVAVPRIKEFL